MSVARLCRMRLNRATSAYSSACQSWGSIWVVSWNPLTTQIEPHDWQAELYADVARFNRILHNLATDMWTYISLGYFAQVRGQGTVGSSTMPHKVNPIRFENAEANLEISSALLDTLAATLVTSRMQRDLADNWEVLGEAVQSVMRAAGVAGVAGMEDPYERLKELTRGRRITGDDMRRFVAGLGLPDDVAARLGAMTPATYTGAAEDLVRFLED